MSETEFNPTSRRNMFFIDPRSIIFDPAENPRLDYGDLKELEASIKEHGVKEPISIKNTPEGPKVMHGFRRMTATMNLINRGEDIARIPAIPVAKGYSDEDALLDHLIRNSGKPLNALEEAGVFKALIGKGYSQTEIAKKVGKTQGAVSNIMKLMETTKLTQNCIIEGKIASTLVMKLMKEHKDAKKVEQVVLSAVAKLDGTSQKKVTEATVQVKRVSKYHKAFSASIEVLRERNVSQSKISKVEAILEALDTTDVEELANKLVSIL